MEKIQEIARYIINLYELWKTYDEKKEIQSLLSKMPKPKAAPQRWHEGEYNCLYETPESL